MPLLGDVFIDTIYSEKVAGQTDTTDHQVEEGLDITDSIKNKPKTMNVSGIITGPDASARRVKLEQYRTKGTLVRYSYRNQWTNVLITSFNSTHDSEVKGGLKFDITIKEIRISKAATIKNTATKKTQPVSNKGLQQPTSVAAAKVYTVKGGDSITKIAAAYKVNAQKLYDKNRGVIGPDWNRIFPGQKLIIPA